MKHYNLGDTVVLTPLLLAEHPYLREEGEDLCHFYTVRVISHEGGENYTYETLIETDCFAEAEAHAILGCSRRASVRIPHEYFINGDTQPNDNQIGGRLSPYL